MRKEEKDLINKRKIAYIYLLHRMFEGSPALMLRVMKFKDVTVAELEDWNIDWKEAVYKVIEEEDARGVKMKDPTRDIPSIASIKDKVLLRIDDLIASTEQPDRLATVFKILSDFEGVDEKKEKGVLDAINDAVKPLTPKRKEKLMTMRERMINQTRRPDAPAGEPEQGVPAGDGTDLNFTDD